MYSYGYPFQQQQPAVDVGQISAEQEAATEYVAAGRSKILFTADDKTIVVKCVGMNGQTSMDYFDRRATTAPPPPPEYVTREELNQMLEALKSPKKGVKTEVAE
jgi:hypothetical protein